jgi:hypothetical protein
MAVQSGEHPPPFPQWLHFLPKSDRPLRKSHSIRQAAHPITEFALTEFRGNAISFTVLQSNVLECTAISLYAGQFNTNQKRQKIMIQACINSFEVCGTQIPQIIHQNRVPIFILFAFPIFVSIPNLT